MAPCRSVRIVDLLHASEARPLSCEHGATSCMQTLRSQSVHVFGRLFASVALVPHYRRFCVRAGCVTCVRAKQFLRASEARSLACEQGLISCARTLKTEVLGATLRHVERLLRRRSNASVSSAGRWSRVASRLFARQWLMADGCGSRVAVLSLGRHSIVARNVCCVDVPAVWHVYLACRQRHSGHHRFRCVAP